jgi:hypothetical protein
MSREIICFFKPGFQVYKDMASVKRITVCRGEMSVRLIPTGNHLIDALYRGIGLFTRPVIVYIFTQKLIRCSMRIAFVNTNNKWMEALKDSNFKERIKDELRFQCRRCF